jgi:hypothetical protein
MEKYHDGGIHFRVQKGSSPQGVSIAHTEVEDNSQYTNYKLVEYNVEKQWKMLPACESSSHPDTTSEGVLCEGTGQNKSREESILLMK